MGLATSQETEAVLRVAVSFVAHARIRTDTHLLLLSTFISCIEVGAAMAVMPVPGIPQSEAATVLGQVSR